MNPIEQLVEDAKTCIEIIRDSFNVPGKRITWLWEGMQPLLERFSDLTDEVSILETERQRLVEENTKLKHHWDYIYEPDAEFLLKGLLVRFIESQVYQAVVENAASEQAARMIAMKSATDNAGELIDSLKLIYNKARQAAITQEISEIVGGAAAVSEGAV